MYACVLRLGNAASLHFPSYVRRTAEIECLARQLRWHAYRLLSPCCPVLRASMTRLVSARNLNKLGRE
jgi:hypothetical protein